MFTYENAHQTRYAPLLIGEPYLLGAKASSRESQTHHEMKTESHGSQNSRMTHFDDFYFRKKILGPRHKRRKSIVYRLKVTETGSRMKEGEKN